MRTRHHPSLASVLLALTLVALPGGALAAEPSPTDPVATVDGLLDTIVAKDFAGVAPFVCADKRQVIAQRFDLEQALGALGAGVDVASLLAGMSVTIDGRSVTLVSNDGTTAQVAVAGTLTPTVDPVVAREFLRQLLTSSGQEVTDALLDQYQPMLIAQLEATQDLADPGITVVLEGGAWLVCDDFGGVSTATPAPTIDPGASLAPMDPAAQAALLAAIPEPLRSACTPDSYWQVPDLGPEPGEIAQVDCDTDGSGGNFVSYSLFDSRTAMDAFYDQQLSGMQALGALDGPGCPTGPGEAIWEHGRRFCFQPFGDDANMRWTYDDLAITASAINDDGDWAALEAFFASAGPIAP